MAFFVLSCAGKLRVGGARRTLPYLLRESVLAVLLLCPGIQECLAQAPVYAAEYRVKAAYVYKFGSYVEWPERRFARPDSPLAIGVIGADALAEELVQIVTGRNVNGHPVEVRKLRPGDPVANLHVLFIGRADGGRLGEILSAARGKGVLTVTESEDGLELGSVINFVMVDDKVRFDVAPPPPEDLKISARLLGVARKVVSRPS